VHTPSVEKGDDSKDRFLWIRASFLNRFPKNHMKILLGDVNAKVEREYFQTDNWD
jgi:hypothetical protein